MVMVLPWTRRRLLLQTQRETEEQLVSVSDQLIQVGEIVGRLTAATVRFEEIATDVINKIEQAREQDCNGNGNGKDAQPGW